MIQFVCSWFWPLRLSWILHIYTAAHSNLIVFTQTTTLFVTEETGYVMVAFRKALVDVETLLVGPISILLSEFCVFRCWRNVRGIVIASVRTTNRTSIMIAQTYEPTHRARSNLFRQWFRRVWFLLAPYTVGECTGWPGNWFSTDSSSITKSSFWRGENEPNTNESRYFDATLSDLGDMLGILERPATGVVGSMLEIRGAVCKFRGFDM